VCVGDHAGRGSRQIPEIFRMYALGGQHIVLRRVEVLYVEPTEQQGKLGKLVEILSESVYAYLKHKGCFCKGWPPSDKEN
jgi:hypothetical protein